LSGCPHERVCDLAAESLAAGLKKRRARNPSEPGVLDRYEGLVEATRLADRERAATERSIVRTA